MTTTVIPTTTVAQWLRSEALFATADDPAVAAAWGDDSPRSSRVTGIAYAGAAGDEATRQQGFMGVGLARDRHLLPGRMAPFIGKVVNITGTGLGYEAGLDVLVLGAHDNLATGMSQVTVLRRV